MYRCRSAFKLMELDSKFNIFNSIINCRTVVDLAAAPGGFSQVALERMRTVATIQNNNNNNLLECSHAVIAFDQRKIESMEGLYTIQCDINNHNRVIEYTNKILGNLEEIDKRNNNNNNNNNNNKQNRRQVQIVLHDGVSVVKSQSAFSVTYGQNQMALGALRLACSLFSKQILNNNNNNNNNNNKCSVNKNLTTKQQQQQQQQQQQKKKMLNSTYEFYFITKAMHSTHFNHILEAAKSYFHSVDVHRPTECKSESLETYIIARGFKPQQWIQEEHFNRGIHSILSLNLKQNDVIKGRQIMWRCWGCGQARLGLTPCPICVKK